MELLQTHSISCPYCGELIDVLVDASVPEQEYIEDCQVCCRPITFLVNLSGNDVSLIVKHENE